ncbi:MAG: DNA translocase FtsK 4TM domain-containing protein [Actinomycetota bacterium]|nr:DNA translocase FtsK 4TM domain-containing protein [Actinomycetota bacterium]
MARTSKAKKKPQSGTGKPARRGGKKRGLPRNIRDILSVSIITVALLLFLAFYIEALGPVGKGLDWLFSYLLGYVRYALPIVLVLLGFALLVGRLGDMAVKDKSAWRLSWVELAGIAVLLLSVCALLHLNVGDHEVMFVRDNLFHGGGFIGAVIAWPLVKLLSKPGAYILVSGMAVVGFLLMTGLTISHYLQDRVEKRRRERREKRSEKGGEPALSGDAGKPAATKKEPSRSPKRSGKDAAAKAFMDVGEIERVPKPPMTPEQEGVAVVVEGSGQLAIEVREDKGKEAYRLPPAELLQRAGERESIPRKSVNKSISILEKTLSDFGVDAAVTRVTRGPTVTRFEVELASGVKVNRLLSLSDDIAYALASPDIRIITPIPGKSAIGIEIPNRERDLVALGDILRTPQNGEIQSPLKVGLGKDVSGKSMIVDLREMPHLLLAGATGTGKSCCINSMIVSILYSAWPQEVRMLMVDPKYVELTHFNGIPHLLAPVITDPKQASGALAWVVREMEQRYHILSSAGVKNIIAYHAALKEGLDKEKDDKGEDAFGPLPYILVFIDELADLMMVAPAEVEESIARIAQMARAVGIHLVVATQRPSVDVVTGIIKANMPSRIAFTVASQADSRVILDIGGAEKLVGHGDMLFLPARMSRPLRVQGAYISEREIAAVNAFIKRQKNASYTKEIMQEVPKNAQNKSRDDDLLEEAMETVVRMGVASASLLQRKLHVGYARAARLVDLLEERGIVGGYEGSKPRAVLMEPEELEERKRRIDKAADEG